MGLAGAQQLAQVQRTRNCPGSAFVVENLSDPTALAAKLACPSDELAKSLRAALPTKIRQQLSPPEGAELDKAVPVALVRSLNKLAKGPCLYDPIRFPVQILSDQTKAFREQNPNPKGSKLPRTASNALVLGLGQASWVRTSDGNINRMLIASVASSAEASAL